MRRILDSHSNIACPTESKFIYQLVKVYDTYQSLEGIKSMGFSEENVLDEIKKFISTFLEGYAKKNGKKRWAEKTTHNVNCLSTIDRIFLENPLYIAIVRHGLDVAYSMDNVTHHSFSVLDKYRYDQEETPVAAIRHWGVMNRKIVDFANSVGKRLFWVKYEELTQTPEKILKQVFDFIKEPFEKQVLEYNKQDHKSARWDDPAATKHKKIVSNSGNYKEWSAVYQDYLYAQSEVLLKYFNYTL